MKFKFKRLSGCARAAIRATARSAGHDLFSAENSVQIILTDIGLKIPKNHCGRICSRFSSALKHTSDGAQVINSDFSGKIYIAFFNFFNKFYQIQIGDRIVHIIFEKISIPVIEEVYEFDYLNNERGVCGFGSTTVVQN